jgi:predicted dehydrogenase
MVKFRVGIVGLRRSLGPARIFRLQPDCEIAGCDLDEAARQRFAIQNPGAPVYADLGEMLQAGVDIVYVGTPMQHHQAHTVAALEAGCHVLQEVALANTLEECRAIFEAVRARPAQKFMLAENCCYWAHIQSWKQVWRQGRLGRFLYAEAEYVHDIRHLLRNPDGTPAWRASRPPIVYCTHSLGPLLQVTGERCLTAVGLHTGSQLEPELGHLDFEAALFQTSSGGVIKVLRAQAVARQPHFHYYSIYGTRGCLETSRPPIAPLRTHAYFEQDPPLQGMATLALTENMPGAPPEAHQGGHGTAEYYMIRDFMESIRRDTPPPLDIYAALEMSLPGLCAHQSAMQGGQPVAIPNWREE